MSKASKQFPKFYTLSALFIILNFAIIQTIFRWSDTVLENLVLVSATSDEASPRRWQYDKRQDILFLAKPSNENNQTNAIQLNKECFEYIYLDFYETNKNKIIPNLCTIQYNASYSVYFRITETLLNFLHLVESLNDWDNGTIYVIKTYPFYKPTHFEEYLIMVYLQQFCNDIECHTTKVFDNYYPFVHYMNDDNGKSYLILFMQYLPNTIKYQDFEKPLWLNSKTEQTLKFLNNCFMNISIVLDELWMIGLLHNDLHKENILVSTENENECYLIDFNQMFKFINLTHSDIKEYRGILSSTSPMSWHYLTTYNDRNRFIQKYGNNSFDKLKQFAFQAQKYKINVFILEALLKSQSIQLLNVNNKQESVKYFTKYVFNTVINDDDRRYHINSSDLFMYEKMKNIWCCRMAQIIYIIQLLNHYIYNNNNNQNMNTVNILQNMFELYSQLKNELNHFDVPCNQCMLNKKYRDLNITAPQYILSV